MDDTETTFDERVAEVRQQRAVGGESDCLATRPDPEPSAPPQRATFPDRCRHPGCTEPAEPGSAYCSNPLHTGSGGSDIDIAPTRPRDDTFGRSDPFGLASDEVEQLRRDVSRLEGKVDALLAALEVSDGDE